MVFPVVGGDGKPTGYDIDNSLRFNDDDSPKLHRAVSSTGSERKCTVSVWVKRASLSSRQQIYSNKTAAESFEAMNMYFRAADNRLEIDHSDGSSSYTQKTTMRFRDVSAWYHIVHSVDTTDATAGDRLRTYVNGVEITAFETDNNPSQNDDLHLSHTTGDQSIGDDPRDSSDLFDGYMAEFAFVDGTALAASDFGETNDNGVWIPKDFKNNITWGTNGFYLEFKQTGTGTASDSTIGADTSGEDNHLTSTNLASTDVTTDTPTNNFCTMNPLGQGGGTLTEGNLKETTDDNAGCPATFAVSNGKWYWEIEITAGSNNLIGIADADYYGLLATTPNDYRIVLYQANGRVYNMSTTPTQDSDSGREFDTNDIMGIRLDLDSGTRTIKWYEDDTLIATENIGSSQVLLTPFSSKGGSSQTCSYNFGNPSFTVSSGNADANGYGNFEFAVPSGHYALCTKNLAEYG
jgi:hypothetical protein